MKANSLRKDHNKLNSDKNSERKENGSSVLAKQTPAVSHCLNNKENIFATGVPVGNTNENSRLNTGNSVLNYNNSNANNDKKEGKCSNIKNNFRRVKEDNYKNCLLDKVHKKTEGKYMILDHNSNSERKNDRSRSNSIIAEKV